MSNQTLRSTGLQHSQSTPRSWLMIFFIISMCTPIIFSVGPLIITPARGFFLVVIAPLTILLLLGRLGRITAPDVLIFLHALWQIIAVAVNNPSQVVQFSGSNILEFWGGYLIGRAAIRNAADFKKFVRLIFITILLLLPFGMLETQTGRSLIMDILSQVGLRTFANAASDPRLGLYRAQAVFQHPIHYGLFASMYLSLFFIGLRPDLSWPKRIIGAVIIFLSVICSVSSGAILPFVMQTLLILWVTLTKRASRRWLILLGILAPTYLLIEMISDRPAHIAILSRISFNAHNVYWRSFAFDWGMINVWANPIFGLGLRDWVRPVFMFSSSVDNFWLLTTMRYGLPGFLLLAVGVLIGMWRVGRRKFAVDGEIATLRLAWMFTMISMSFTLVTVHVWGTLYAFVMAMFGTGIWFIDHEETQSDSAPRQSNAQYAPQYTRLATKRTKRQTRSLGRLSDTRLNEPLDHNG